MFGLFKKTSWKIEGKNKDFFRQIFTKLPEEFQFLNIGLDKGLYKRFSVNHAMKGNYYSIGFDPSQSDKSMVKGKQFLLESIIIQQNSKTYPLNLSVYEGLWVGFEFEKNISELTDFQIDISTLRKNKDKFEKDKKLEKLIHGLKSDLLDLNNLGEFELENNLYYQIKDLEDGNYLAIDKEGQVFGLIHDPYEIKLLNKSLRQFVSDVNSGKFDLEKYINNKNGYA